MKNFLRDYLSYLISVFFLWSKQMIIPMFYDYLFCTWISVKIFFFWEKLTHRIPLPRDKLIPTPILTPLVSLSPPSWATFLSAFPSASTLSCLPASSSSLPASSNADVSVARFPRATSAAVLARCSRCLLVGECRYDHPLSHRSIFFFASNSTSLVDLKASLLGLIVVCFERNLGELFSWGSMPPLPLGPPQWLLRHRSRSRSSQRSRCLGCRNANGDLLWDLYLLSFTANFKIKLLQRMCLEMVVAGFWPDLATLGYLSTLFIPNQLYTKFWLEFKW